MPLVSASEFTGEVVEADVHSRDVGQLGRRRKPCWGHTTCNKSAHHLWVTLRPVSRCYTLRSPRTAQHIMAQVDSVEAGCWPASWQVACPSQGSSGHNGLKHAL